MHVPWRRREEWHTKTYSVKDIADMLQTNPETVRRWIRAGKLKADQTSRKDGNVVREDELYKYLLQLQNMQQLQLDSLLPIHFSL
ncbi:helix-turn-helix domain-containing protein [Sellimonas catena]|uniref:helix-turn-helix domain-containing protein n=1 Tax=Sellimonas catena TaxID=2994035 RepID=UPI00386D2D17